MNAVRSLAEDVPVVRVDEASETTGARMHWGLTGADRGSLVNAASIRRSD